MKEKIFGEIENMILFFAIIGITIMVATTISYLIKRSIAKRKTSEEDDITNYQFLRHILVGMIYLIGIGWAFLVLPIFNTIAHTLLTGAGIVAVVAGIASQQVLSNIASGIFMVVSKPFRVHDRVTIRGNMTGFIEDITLRHTIIRDLDNNRIIIPNSVMGTEVIINTHIGDKKVCRKIDVSVHYKSDIDKAMSIMQEEVKKHPLHSKPDGNIKLAGNSIEPFTQILSLADSAVVLRVWAWSKSENDALIMEGELLRNIKLKFDEAGIEIPFPQRVITHVNLPIITEQN